MSELSTEIVDRVTEVPPMSPRTAALILGAVVVGFGGIVYFAVKDDKRVREERRIADEEWAAYQEELGSWMREQNGQGRVVYKTSNGGYVSTGPSSADQFPSYKGRVPTISLATDRPTLPRTPYTPTPWYYRPLNP